jgi:hypothetical protein
MMVLHSNKLMLPFKNNIYKEYPATRICTIDYYPVILESIKESYETCRQLGLTGNHWSKHTSDITKLFLHHTLNSLCDKYTECNSVFRKVYIVYPVNTDTNTTRFINNYLQKVLKICPFPWCKVPSLSSPEIESAAVRAADKHKSNYSRTFNFTKNNSLHAFTKKMQKKRIFSNSIVDFSRAHD